MIERLRSSSGQATIELIALLPLCATFGLAIGHVLAAEATRELAGHAAEAAAIAVGNGADASSAARAALPEWSQDRVAVEVSGRAVRVRLEPPAVVPALADALASTATADAGPAAEPSAPTAPEQDGSAETDGGVGESGGARAPNDAPPAGDLRGASAVGEPAP